MTPRPSNAHHLSDLLRRTGAVLLDFDGPICRFFAGLDPRDLAFSLHPLLPDNGAGLPADAGPHEALLHTLDFPPEVSHRVDAALRRAEIEAVATATPTPGAAELLREASNRWPVAIVSNNAAEAVHRYLDQHRLAGYVRHVEGRDPHDPRRMKPSPEPVKRASRALRTPVDRCLLVGDSVFDIESARQAGARSVGYANRPGKHERLAGAGADIVIDDLDDLVDAIAGHGP